MNICQCGTQAGYPHPSDCPFRYYGEIPAIVKKWQTARRVMLMEYVICDDWFIFAKDETGQMWYVSTETWPEWLELPRGSDEEENAVEKYMLPIARANWLKLNWQKVPEEFKNEKNT